MIPRRAHLAKALISFLLLSASMVSVRAETISPSTNGSFLPPGEWELVFEDDFKGGPDSWKEGWVADSSASKHILSSRWPENVTVEDGSLRLLNRKESRGGQGHEWTSGSVSAKDKRFQYGYYECRYKYAAAPGVNNSFWLITNPREMPNSLAGTPQGTHFELDINEGHYPNQITCNIHKWTPPHTSSGKMLQLGAKPFFNFPLEIPITTDGIRLQVSDAGRVSVIELRALAPSQSGYPELLDSKGNPLPANPSINLLTGGEVTANSQVGGLSPKNVLDARLTKDSRWVVEGAKGSQPNELTVILPKPVTIGCLQMLSGYQQNDDWTQCVSIFKLQYRKNGQWIDLAGTDKASEYTDLSKDYHVYGFEWTPEELIFYYDGKERRRVKNEFCHFPASLLMSSAIIRWAGQVSDRIDGTSQDIDWVRVWKRKSSTHRVMIPLQEIRAQKDAADPKPTPVPTEPALPEGGASYSGGLKGKVVTVDPKGKSFCIAVASVTPNSKCQATNPKALEANTVTLFPSNLQNSEGRWVQAKEDIAFISSLKPDQEVEITVYSRPNKPNRLFLERYPGLSGPKTPGDS